MKEPRRSGAAHEGASPTEAAHEDPATPAYRPFDSAVAALALLLISGAVHQEMPLYRADAYPAG